MSYGLLWLKQFVLSITSVILVFIFYRIIHYSYGGSIWYATHCAKINYDGKCSLLKNKFGQVNFKRQQLVRIGIMKAKIIDFKNFQLKLLQSNSLTKKKKNSNNNNVVIFYIFKHGIYQ